MNWDGNILVKLCLKDMTDTLEVGGNRDDKCDKII